MSTYTPPPVGTRYATKEAYLAARGALIAADRAQHPTTTASPSSALESRANAVVASLKQREISTTNTATIPLGFEPGHKFLHGIPHPIARSSLFAIASRAPKGALLHCHLDAMLPPSLLLEDARRQPNLCIRTDAPLTSAAFLAAALPTFQVLPEADVRAAEESGVSVFESRYVSGTWMPYARFLVAFPGGAQAAEEWVCGKVVLSAADAYETMQTVDGIWTLFKRSFMVLRGLTGYVTAWKNHFKRVLWHCARDGIGYAEIRVPMKWDNFVWRDDGTAQLNRREMVGLLKEVLEQEEPKIKGEGLVWWGVKFIYGSFRLAERENMKWMMDDAIDLKQAYPDLICGFDMQGQEDDGHSHLHWIQELLDFRARCDELGLDYPFIFHAGETLTTATSSNLYDAILLSTKRIGHAFSLARHPLLTQLCRDRGIAIESCPISNEVLGLTPSGIKNHPLPILLGHGVPCTLNSDDPGCWDAGLLSHDWYQVLVADSEMDLRGWRRLAEWSLEYSCMPEGNRAEAMRAFAQEWERFCAWVVETYGNEME
ncbi:putative adenosine deaminase [Neofusicoccum parvum]|nr:putative adenosine deaminase [Neofusicoccum parvum]